MKPGTEITIMLPPPTYARRGGEVIADMWGKVGIKAKLVPIEWAQWLDQVFKRTDYDATIISHTEARDLDIYARDKYYFNYHSDAYKALYQKFVEAVEPKAQLDLVGELQKKLAEDEPNVFLFALAKVGVWNAKLRGHVGQRAGAGERCHACELGELVLRPSPRPSPASGRGRSKQGEGLFASPACGRGWCAAPGEGVPRA